MHSSPHPESMRDWPRASLSMETPFAFFDVDETLIRIKSMFSFKEFFHMNYYSGTKAERAHRHMQFIRQIEEYSNRGMSRELINRFYYESYCGYDQQHVRDCAYEWFSELKATMPDLYINQSLERLRKHQALGEEPVLVSGSFIEILTPLAEELNVQHMLATRLEIKGGRYTGRIIPPQMIGNGKRAAAERFLEEHNSCPNRCFAYGDHPSDLPLLEAVGHPSIVGNNRRMLSVADKFNWNVIHI